MKHTEKRLAALVLALCMAACMLPCAGLAADYELTEKLMKQPTGSAYDVKGIFTVRGAEMGWPLDRVFSAMKEWNGADFRLSGTGTTVKKNGISCYDMDTGIAVTGHNGAEMFSLRILNNNDQVAFGSSLTSDQFWGFEKDGLISMLVNTGIIGEGAATVLRVLSTAGNDSMDAALGAVIEEAGFWMSDYCRVEQENGQITLIYTVPGRALANELAAVLEQLRQDEEAALCLQPVLGQEAWDMLLGEGSEELDLRGMKIDGSAVLIRTYDTAANLTRLDAELPFPEGVPLQYVSLTVTPLKDGDVYDITLTPLSGEFEKITLQKIASGWQGAYTRGERAFGFVWEEKTGATSYDRSKDQMTQDVSFCLSILPADGNDIHSMKVTCDLHMYSASGRTTALYMTGELRLTDETAGSGAMLSFSGNCMAGTQTAAISSLTVNWIDSDPAAAAALMDMLDSALSGGKN